MMALLMVSGCGGEDEKPTQAPSKDEDAVVSTLRSYIGHLAAGEPREACALMTREAQRSLVDAVTRSGGGIRGASCVEVSAQLQRFATGRPRVTQVQVKGDDASASAQVGSLPATKPRLVRDGDGWKISAF